MTPLINLRFDIIEMSVRGGAEIGATIREALSVAKTYHCPVHFHFNGVEMKVSGDDPAALLVDFYRRDARINP